MGPAVTASKKGLPAGEEFLNDLRPLLGQLDPFLRNLNGPQTASVTRVDATHWTIAFTGKEGTQIEYKYTLGDWDHVEKDGACGEIGNRLLTLSYGASGTQVVGDTVANWRTVAPCGN